MVKKNIPLYERVTTISGDGVNKPGNYICRLGTLYSDAVELAAGGLKGTPGKFISGGMMMAFPRRASITPLLNGPVQSLSSIPNLLLLNMSNPAPASIALAASTPAP